MKEDLSVLLDKCAIYNNIEKQQALKQIIIELRLLAVDLELDFDLALDKSEPEITFPPSDCQHIDAFPFGGDSVYCPNCKECIIKGKTTPDSDYLKQNHWRE